MSELPDPRGLDTKKYYAATQTRKRSRADSRTKPAQRPGPPAQPAPDRSLSTDRYYREKGVITGDVLGAPMPAAPARLKGIPPVLLLVSSQEDVNAVVIKAVDCIQRGSRRVVIELAEPHLRTAVLAQLIRSTSSGRLDPMQRQRIELVDLQPDITEEASKKAVSAVFFDEREFQTVPVPPAAAPTQQPAVTTPAAPSDEALDFMLAPAAIPPIALHNGEAALDDDELPPLNPARYGPVDDLPELELAPANVEALPKAEPAVSVPVTDTTSDVLDPNALKLAADAMVQAATAESKSAKRKRLKREKDAKNAGD